MAHTLESEATLIIDTASPEATQAAGAALAACVQPGQVIALSGNLGAGKTTFVQGLAVGLGVKAHVTSPTFILVNEYRTPGGTRLVHIDTYRLGDPVHGAMPEAAALGLEELLDTPDAVVAVEWAERVAALLPPDYLAVTLEHAGDARRITLTAHGSASMAALDALRRAYFAANGM